VSSDLDPFASALLLLARTGVEFVIVGVAGINFYARDASELVVTGDLDLLVAPRTDTLRSALAALGAEGFRFEAGGEPFLDFSDESVLARIVEAGANVVARSPEGAHLDLMLSMAGFRFDELAPDAESFRMGELVVRVGRLEKLLRSKELAGRRKDIEFLRLYASRLRDGPGRP
jgi:hypothetical protein